MTGTKKCANFGGKWDLSYENIYNSKTIFLTIFTSNTAFWSLSPWLHVWCFFHVSKVATLKSIHSIFPYVHFCSQEHLTKQYSLPSTFERHVNVVNVRQ